MNLNFNAQDLQVLYTAEEIDFREKLRTPYTINDSLKRQFIESTHISMITILIWYNILNKDCMKVFFFFFFFGGARAVMVIVVGNGHGNTSSNPGRG